MVVLVKWSSTMRGNVSTRNNRDSTKMYKRSNKESHRLISVSSSSWRLFPELATVFILLSTIAICATAQDLAAELTSDTAVQNSNPQPKSQGTHCSPFSNINGYRTLSCYSYTTIPTDIERAAEVQVLNMTSGNSLQKLRNGDLERANLTSLKKLILRSCSILDIEIDAFKGGENIVELDLSSNSIDKLDPRVFKHFHHLTTLYLNNNPIHKFYDGTFPPLKLLTKIDLSGCELDGVGVPVELFDNLERLNTLRLNNNQFKSLDWRVFRKIKGISTLTLGGSNPWVCDCRVKFLKEFLESHSQSNSYQDATCKSTGKDEPRSIGAKWADVNAEEMSCAPEIQDLVFTKFDEVHASVFQAEDNYKDDDPNQIKVGQTVQFECRYSGYPAPTIDWYKDGKPVVPSSSAGHPLRRRAISETLPTEAGIEETNNKTINEKPAPVNLPPSSASAPQKPRIESKDATFGITRSMSDEETKRNYKFIKTLTIRRLQAEDRGRYSCMVTNMVGVAEKNVLLNLTVPDDIYFGGILPGGKKGVAIWMWILIGLICILILVLIGLLIFCVYKRREKKKQEGFRKVVHEKFKDSNIDLGEFDTKLSSNSQQSKGSNNIDGATPLLDNRSETSTLPMTENHLHRKVPPLPDVALGNATLIRNSQIFSPKPPPALHGYPTDARKEFFARQISEPYLRPASAMSLSRPAALNASQRRYIFANQIYQSDPVQGDQENLYAVPSHTREMPRSGSAMSVSALPEYDLRRQMWLKQYSQPQSQYGTSARIPVRRLPSTSSEPPPEQMASAFQYSTLPRRPIRLQSWSRPVSPTNSTCSTYSTLSWRPVDPRTGVMSDGMGARNTAHGGSTQSVNKIPDLTGTILGEDYGSGIESMNRAMLTPSSAGKVKNARTPRYGHSRTPSSLTRGHNEFFSFEPIQEVESSECASNLNLDRAGGRQTPTGMPYSTQSLARGEPRYKRKKPPPITMIPTNLKTPSRAFEHLKGRSVSPALRNNVVNGDQPTEEKPSNNNDDSAVVATRDNSAPTIESVANTITNTSSIPVPVLESPIDEDVSNQNKSSSKAPPPPPPPKPKRSQNQDEEPKVNGTSDGPTPEPGVAEDNDTNKPVTASDGTVV